MIHSDNPILRDDFVLERDHWPVVRCYERDSYIIPPDWMPIFWPTYEWVYVNQISPMMRPALRMRDRVRFQLPNLITPRTIKAWIAKKRFRRVLKRDVDVNKGDE